MPSAAASHPEPPPGFELGPGPSAAPAADAATTGVPVLAGPARDELFAVTGPARPEGVFLLRQEGARLLGWASVPLDAPLEAVAHRTYRELLARTRGLHLCRIWNYVPAINATGPHGLENYQAFSRGRSLAFEAEFGPAFTRVLPAASAVGCRDPRLGIAFLATPDTPVHVENPDQVPAYEYPARYGPRPPSFARATAVPVAPGRRDIFISGTSAIRGHATVAPGDTLAQLSCTLENLRTVARVCALDADFARGRARARHAKVYLRHAADLPAVSDRLRQELFAPEDRVSYLHADICRADLNVELEWTLLGAPA